MLRDKGITARHPAQAALGSQDSDSGGVLPESAHWGLGPSGGLGRDIRLQVGGSSLNFLPPVIQLAMKQ